MLDLAILAAVTVSVVAGPELAVVGVIVVVIALINSSIDNQEGGE